MIITFFRSSSLNAWEMCNFRWFLEYNLGIKSVSNQAADKGSITHKALELLARRKLASQNRQAVFHDDELGRDFLAASITPDQAIALAWDHYTKKCAAHKWTEAEHEQVKKWTYHVLEYNNGQFSPLKRTIVAPEQHFDLLIEQEWAKYHYTLPDGRVLDGYLGIKGTIDLLTEAKPGVLEYSDYKTGSRKDWVKMQPKEYEDLRNDSQLRLYHYALSRLYPDAKSIVITIYFIADGGPFSLAFDQTDLKKTEEMLRKKFECIRNTQRPRWIRGTPRKWQCTSFCWYGKNKQPGTDQSVCEYMRGELLALGLDKVFAKHGRPEAVTSYGEGGGRTHQ